MAIFNAAEIEKQVHERWKKDRVPEKIVAMDWNRKKFYLLDGPPYINGVPHVGTAKTTVFKDIWGKFKYMQGFSVWFQPGFDCGGLPIENKVEKELKIKSKTEIEEMGADKFIKACQKFAKGNEPIWLNFYKKIGAWRGWLDPYLTSENYYIESGWWTVKNWFEKGLLVEGVRPGFWCSHCETVLAGIEASESYQSKEDPYVVVKFRVKNTDEFILAFTTTPWTLPANVALAVHSDEKYVKVKVKGEEGKIILAEKRLAFLDELGKEYKVIEKVNGKELAELKYEPLLDVPLQHELEKKDNCHRIILSMPIMLKRIASKTQLKQVVQEEDEFGQFVTMDVGTGIVHTAPGHGHTDNAMGKHYNLEEPSPVDEKGRFTKEAGKFAGKYVKDADREIIEELKKTGRLFHHGRTVHSYPLCWRCKTPLIYRMSRQWFLKIDTLREKIIKANKKIRWLPEFAAERYHNTITEAPDWAVTRQRYWGIPLPIWTCSKCTSKKVIGSAEELRKESIVKLSEHIDLHKNYVDKIKIKCECSSEMEREKDIMDVWFDSGIAPWASLGYPFRNKELFKKLWKIDLVDESQDQVKAWFDKLMVCSFATFDEAPYETVCLNGWTLDEKGDKMSKSLGNVIQAADAYEELKADVLRLYYCVDTAPWDTQKFSLKNAKELEKTFNILLNSYNYFKTYSKPEYNKYDLEIEDKWILSKLNTLVKEATSNLGTFNFHLVGRGIVNFLVNDFSRMYIKIIRERRDKAVDYTLTNIMENIVKILAPISPFISDYLHFDMAGSSVHMQRWPEADESFIDRNLEEEMGIADKIVTAVSAARKEKNIKLRWPLPLLVVSSEIKNKEIKRVIKILCKVKKVEFGKDETLYAKDFEGGKIYLDTTIIKDEALLRELTREIQAQRKKENLTVSDRIVLCIDNENLEQYKDEIMERVGASVVKFEKIDFGKEKGKITFDEEVIRFDFHVHNG